jgi:NitT/TauT family transport system substrate-binding protein
MIKRNKLLLTIGCFIVILITVFTFVVIPNLKSEPKLGVAVEFNTHAACAYIALEKGWYHDEGIELNAFDSYVTGVALTSALARGDIQVAYLCVGPAIIAKARGVPIKIVSGTHRYGYSIVAKPEIKNISDLEGRKVGCVNEGAQTDLLLQVTIRKFNLTNIEVLRMNPPKQIMALASGQIDAAFLPEHHATLAESLGFHTIAKSQDIWPNMLGSVLVVKEDLINNNPELVQKLVEITERGTKLAKESPTEASKLVASQLKIANPLGVDESIIAPQVAQLTPELIEKSMRNLDYTCNVEPKDLGEYIVLLKSLGYIEGDIQPQDLLDLRFIG